MMPTAKESICCREMTQIENKLQESDVSNVSCITEHEGFQSVCLDQWVLQTAASQTRQEHGRHAISRPAHKLVHKGNMAMFHFRFSSILLSYLEPFATWLIVNWQGGAGDILAGKYVLCYPHVQLIEYGQLFLLTAMLVLKFNCNATLFLATILLLSTAN